jgi:drug/metabolite transporter (DMT)-like permease
MSNRFISWALFTLLTFIWGSSFILMKIGYEALSPTQIAGVRIFSGGLVFIPFAIFHLTKVPGRKVPLLIVAGLTGNLIPAFLFTAAITKLDSSLEGILNSLTPIWVVTIGILIYRDKIQTRKIIGVLVGFAGLVLLTLSQKEVSLDNLGYSSLVILATLCYGFNVQMVSHYLKGIPSFHIATISLALMTIPAGIVLWWNGFFELDFSDSAVQWSTIASLMLGLAGSALGNVLFYGLVNRAGALFTSLVTYAIPFVALLWGVLDGELVTWKELVCLAIILSGVYLTNKKN